MCIAVNAAKCAAITDNVSRTLLPLPEIAELGRVANHRPGSKFCFSRPMRRKTESTRDNTKEKAVIAGLSPSTRRASAVLEEENMDVSEIEVCCTEAAIGLEQSSPSRAANYKPT